MKKEIADEIINFSRYKTICTKSNFLILGKIRRARTKRKEIISPKEIISFIISGKKKKKPSQKRTIIVV